MSFEETDTEESASSLSEVNFLDYDFDRNIEWQISNWY
jgi:hypothetical protein